MKRNFKVLILALFIGLIVGLVMRWDQARGEPIAKRTQARHISDQEAKARLLGYMDRDELREIRKKNF